MNAPESIEVQPVAPASTTRYRQHATEPDHHLMDDAERAARKQRSRRATFIKWLRKVHGWVGLWGAAIGLLFGVTGFLLNHRAGPLKVSSGEPQVEQLQIALPEGSRFRSPMDMAHWLKGELKIEGNPGRARREPSHPVAWGDHSVVQPEFWQVGFAGTKENLQAEYWVGNDYVSVKRTQNSFLGELNNLHRGVGLSIGWVLFIDTFAGGILLLSLTGVLLWTELNRRRTVGVVLVLGSIAAAVMTGLI
ncbi:PepSY-associated TM helix domain-containing protein [Paraburkholderia sp. GAS334]|uniref:PepSY-associated TM helix domain-containing protein n=1 Tax=unclassified Paraburkholderia TaxID=2615204 RepID=UPI003D24DFBA